MTEPTRVPAIRDAVLRHVGRAARCDFTRMEATPSERASLAAARRPVTDPAAQDYLSWRRSMAWVALPAVAVALLVDLVDWLGDVGEEEFTGTYHLLRILLLGAQAWLGVALAAGIRRWAEGDPTRRWLRTGWGVHFLAPFLLALVPLLPLMVSGEVPDGPLPDVTDAFQRLQQGLGTVEDQQALDRWGAVLAAQLARLLLGVQMLLGLAPVFLSIFPGITRAGLTVKTLLPGWSVGALVAALMAPVYAAGFLVVGVVLQQVGGSLWLALGLFCFLAGPLTYTLRASALVRPMSREQARETVGAAKRRAGWLVGAGGLLILVALFRTEILGRPLVGFGEGAILGPFDLLGKVVAYVGSVTAFTVVATDALVQGLSHADRSADAFRASPDHARDARRLVALTGALTVAPVQGPPPVSGAPEAPAAGAGVR